MFAGLSDDVIITRAQYSTAEIKDKKKKYFDMVYSEVYNKIMDAYREAGYGKKYGGFFGVGAKKLEFPYAEIRAQATQISNEIADKAVKDEEREMIRVEKESVEQQKWQHTQVSRGRSSGLLESKYGVAKGGQYLTSKPVGETVFAKIEEKVPVPVTPKPVSSAPKPQNQIIAAPTVNRYLDRAHIR